MDSTENPLPELPPQGPTRRTFIKRSVGVYIALTLLDLTPVKGSALDGQPKCDTDKIPGADPISTDDLPCTTATSADADSYCGTSGHQRNDPNTGSYVYTDPDASCGKGNNSGGTDPDENCGHVLEATRHFDPDNSCGMQGAPSDQTGNHQG